MEGEGDYRISVARVPIFIFEVARAARKSARPFRRGAHRREAHHRLYDIR